MAQNPEVVQYVARNLRANPAQAKLWASKAKYILWLGGAGGGKTIGAMHWACRLIAEYPGIKIPVCRLYHNSFATTTRSDFEAEIPAWCYTANNQYDFWRFKNGSMLYWLGLDMFASRQGMNIGAFIVDQAEELEQKHLDFLDLRLRQRQGPRQGLFLANVPQRRDHWIYDNAMKNPLFEVITGGVLENRENLPEDYVRSLIEGRTDAWVRRHVLGEYTPPQDEPPVYPEYRLNMLLQKDVDAVPGTVLRGFDGGPTDNFYACVWWQRQSRYVVLAELLMEMAGAGDFGRRVVEMSNELFPDCEFVDDADQPMFTKAHTDQRSPADVLLRCGIKLRRGVVENSVRKQRVRDLLNRTIDGDPALAVNPRCEIFHEGMSGRYYKAKDQFGQYKEPKKTAHSHLVEAFETSFARQMESAGIDEGLAAFRAKYRDKRGAVPILGRMRAALGRRKR